MKHDVFISYSRKDYVDENKEPLPGNIIDKLLHLFDKADINPWIDKKGIYSGDAWAKTISKAIADSAIFLFVSSKHSNSSECWSADEIALARNKRKHIIPLLIDDTPYNDDFALFIARLDYVNYASEGDTALAKMVDSINKKLDETDPNRKQIRQLKELHKELRDTIMQKECERKGVIEQLAALGVEIAQEEESNAALANKLRREIEELKKKNEELRLQAESSLEALRREIAMLNETIDQKEQENSLLEVKNHKLCYEIETLKKKNEELRLQAESSVDDDNPF